MSPRPTVVRTFARTFLLAAFVLVAAACEAKVATVVTPSAGDVKAHVSVKFSGPAAEVVNANDELAARLATVFSDRLGTEPDRTGTDPVVWSADVSPDKLTAAAAVTGIGGISSDSTGTDHVTVVVQTVVPAELVAALEADPDPDAARTLVQATTMTVTIEMPGGIDAGLTTLPADTTLNATSATYTRSLPDWSAVTLRVTGDPTAPSRFPWVNAAGIVVAAGTLFIWAVRRRR